MYDSMWYMLYVTDCVLYILFGGSRWSWAGRAPSSSSTTRVCHRIYTCRCSECPMYTRRCSIYTNRYGMYETVYIMYILDICMQPYKLCIYFMLYVSVYIMYVLYVMYTYVEVSLELGGKSALIVLEDAAPPSYMYVHIKYMSV